MCWRRWAAAAVAAVAACGFPPLERLDPPSGWAPVAMVPGVNTPRAEDDPSFTKDLNTVVSTSRLASGGMPADIYLGTRATPDGTLTANVIPALTSTDDDASPEITADGSQIYFTAKRADRSGRHVYRSTSTSGTWSPPELMQPLSSDQGEEESDVGISPGAVTATSPRAGGFLISRSDSAEAP